MNQSARVKEHRPIPLDHMHIYDLCIYLLEMYFIHVGG